MKLAPEIDAKRGKELLDNLLILKGGKLRKGKGGYMKTLVLAIAALALAGCASAANLKPGVPRGMLEEGFDKTTEGLSMTVRDRSLDEVWQAALRGAIAVTRSDSHAKIIERQPPRLIKLEGSNFLGIETVSYTGIFLIPASNAVEVQVTKIYKARMAVVHYGASEGDYLRAIQAELKR